MHGSLATRLRVLRAERGLTVRQVAELSGVAKETISQVERGERHPYDRTLAKLAHAYDVPVGELLEEPEGARPATNAEAPELTLEQFTNHYVEEDILPTPAELAALNELLKTYTEIAQTGAKRGKFMAPPGVDVRRVDMLFWHAARSGILTPEDLHILEHGVARELAAGRP